MKNHQEIPQEPLLVLGLESNQWNVDAVRQSFSKPGRQGTCPPDSVRAGTVNHFYERPQVMSVAIEPSAIIHVGDTLIIRLQDRYHSQVIDSLEINRSAVTQAQGGD